MKHFLYFPIPGTEHCHKASAPGAENDRTMIFYDEARVDGLVKRIETPLSMTEHYKNRDDFQYYKHVDFGKRTKKFGPQDEVVKENPRPIVVCEIFIIHIILIPNSMKTLLRGGKVKVAP